MPATINRMHTAEHLLSAVMRKFYKAPRNLEFHHGEKKTKCDYQVPNSISDTDISQIETLVNREIENNHPVSSFMIRKGDAGDYDLWKVPQDADEIRIIKIGDFDAQPCRGEHVSQTSGIGVFRIISYELRENGRVRIRFKLE